MPCGSDATEFLFDFDFLPCIIKPKPSLRSTGIIIEIPNHILELKMVRAAENLDHVLKLKPYKL